MRTLLPRLVPALALIALAVPASASAQATRTFVSGVGTDTNPCSRTAPCKTFAGAISKTASGGIINCMDPGGFGPLTITKSLTVDCRPFLGAMLASGGINAVNVAAGVNDIVTLMGLDIEGEGTTLGLNGIRITQAKAVHILDTQIHRFSRSGVTLEPNAGVTTTLTLDRVDIHDNNGNGINVAPQNTAVARVTVRDARLANNGCGIVATQFGMDAAFNFANNCATGGANANTPALAVNVFDTGISDSATNSVLSSGVKSTVRLGANTITGSLGPALLTINSGAILTWGNNMVAGNPGGNGLTTGTIGLTKRAARKHAIAHCAKRHPKRTAAWCAKRYAHHHV